jgi:uncharacterized alkaline shock family protein YloU
MKTIHVLSGLVLFLLLGAAAGFLMYGGVRDPELLGDGVGRLGSQRILAFCAGLAVICLVLLYLFSGIRREREAQFISFDGQGGTVRISIKAVRDFVRRIGEEYADVIDLQPDLQFRGGDVRVDLNVSVKAGTHIPELTQMLQQRVRESVQDHLGVSEVSQVRVNVREIVPAAGTAGVSAEQGA